MGGTPGDGLIIDWTKMKLTKMVLIAVALLATLGASAQEAVIRKNLLERLPQLQ